MMQTTSSLKYAVRAILVAASLMAALAPTATYAFITPMPATMHAFVGGKQKMIHFNLRNQSGTSVDLRAGDQTMTVAAGQTVELKLAAGTRIVTASKTDKREAGAMICEVTPTMSDTTLVMN